MGKDFQGMLSADQLGTVRACGRELREMIRQAQAKLLAEREALAIIEEDLAERAKRVESMRASVASVEATISMLQDAADSIDEAAL